MKQTKEPNTKESSKKETSKKAPAKKEPAKKEPSTKKTSAKEPSLHFSVDWSKTQKIKALKNTFKTGLKVRLKKMDDEDPIPKGTIGTVKGIDNDGYIIVDWENDERMALDIICDSFEIVRD